MLRNFAQAWFPVVWAGAQFCAAYVKLLLKSIFIKESDIMAHRKDVLPSDPNFLLKYLEEMPSDGESDDDFDGYITDEDVEDEEESSCTAISSSTLTSCDERTSSISTCTTELFSSSYQSPGNDIILNLHHLF